MNGIIVRQLVIDILKNMKKSDEMINNDHIDLFKKGYSVGLCRTIDLIIENKLMSYEEYLGLLKEYYYE